MKAIKGIISINHKVGQSLVVSYENRLNNVVPEHNTNGVE